LQQLIKATFLMNVHAKWILLVTCDHSTALAGDEKLEYRRLFSSYEMLPTSIPSDALLKPVSEIAFQLFFACSTSL